MSDRWPPRISPSSEALDAALARRAAGATLLLLLDLDGTLASFRVDPAKVELHPGMRLTLRRLLARPRTRLVIVTGRRAPEAAGIVGLAGVEVVGLHGAEFLRHGKLSGIKPSLAARKALDRLLVVGKELAEATPGSRFEDKRPGGVVLHTRGASAAKAAKAERLFAAAIRREKKAGLSLMTGKRMAEGRVGGSDKGTAATALASEAVKLAGARRPAPVILFAGDDVTDEDAHRALQAFDALTVLVSARGKPSAARFRVPSIAALKGILDRLAC